MNKCIWIVGKGYDPYFRRMCDKRHISKITKYNCPNCGKEIKCVKYEDMPDEYDKTTTKQ